MNRFAFFLIGLLPGCLMWLSSCTGGVAGRPVTFVRADRIWTPFRDTSRSAVYARADSLRQCCGDFAVSYLEYLLHAGVSDTVLFVRQAQAFSADSMVRQIYDAVECCYPDLAPEEKALAGALSRCASSFGTAELPVLVTAVSCLGESMMVSDRVLALSLDKYLGTGHPLYILSGYPAYRRRCMVRQALVPDAVRAWIYAGHPPAMEHPSLLDVMLYEGRVAYAVKYSCPTVPDTVLFGCSAGQLQWYLDHRQAVWEEIQQRRMLSESDAAVLQRLFQPAPFTPEFSASSPGRLLILTGFEVVSSYMKRYPDTSLAELFALDDADALLREARYHP